MVDLVMLQVMRDLVAIFGVIAGFSYYVMVVRNANKSRRTQVVLNLRSTLFNEEMNRNNIELLSMQWEDFEDFRRKYDSTVDPDKFSRRWKTWSNYEGMGYLLHEGIIDIDMVYNLLGSFGILQLWQKYEPIIMEQRRFYNEPHWFRWWEYLASEISKKRVELGLPARVTDPDVYTKEF